MKNRRNYYRILHVQPDAPHEVIRSSYRTMMQRMKLHPDLGGDCAEASLVNEAYTVLRNADARARYDKQCDLAEERPPAADARSAHKSNHEPARASGYPNTESSTGHCGFCNLKLGSSYSIIPEDNCHRCASPLYPAHKQRLGRDSQRAIRRINRRQAITFFINGDAALAFAGHTQDLSLHGMQFVTDQPPTVGNVIKIDAAMCQATARVVNCHPAPGTSDPLWRIGVEFLTLRFEKPSGSFVSATA